ncbi:hypothetical protein [Nostoc sp. DedQUE07]|uniref:hypothetical protein n=1 Tax=Nostoc sp. DedQUE07 TaxID=3075392 RepID=UPI002AD583A5|nr:hypothetical protein [Nostoc sp. DedQUE07]MDZ8129995.1 hypothetical protein [Nostoc sp. DedQUE07]
MQTAIKAVSVGLRWQELAAYLQPQIHEHAIAFLDLQYIYALVRGVKMTGRQRC